MRNNTWGHPPKNDLWGDFQALAIWIFIIGVVGYLLFPDFFHKVYDQLAFSGESIETIDEITLPTTTDEADDTTVDTDDSDLPSVYNSLYTGDSEISDGYWAIFVQDNEFQQLALSSESYGYILKIIDSDTKGQAKKILLLSSNGQIHKYTVTEEMYNIILNLNKINTRSGLI
ncbi:hypothetical protein LPY66_12700 [Dehalobacter sp. DCM]|uniref:hypothetical protein n=1 Tax=Dehalobacter sp. DCM TaxID=2907827 RepID=UPI00308191C2|nr:hypothetical protein LPY66_12700 [Dehalobacter sp. DCM]